VPALGEHVSCGEQLGNPVGPRHGPRDPAGLAHEVAKGPVDAERASHRVTGAAGASSSTAARM
jgi:hypothetical protein